MMMLISSKIKFKYACLFAFSFAVLTSLSFTAGLFISIRIAPSPVAQAMADYLDFAPVMGIGAFILGLLQALLIIWLFQVYRSWTWPVVLIIALTLGGLFSFFSFWIIWALITIVNVLLNLAMLHFFNARYFKTDEN